MESEQLMQILTLMLVVIVMLIIVLLAVGLVIWIKKRKESENKEQLLSSKQTKNAPSVTRKSHNADKKSEDDQA